jgi:hypothetical protein
VRVHDRRVDGTARRRGAKHVYQEQGNPGMHMQRTRETNYGHNGGNYGTCSVWVSA